MSWFLYEPDCQPLSRSFYKAAFAAPVAVITPNLIVTAQVAAAWVLIEDDKQLTNQVYQ
jgi:hypothetical protein